MTEWINLREERDFGEKFNATFQFASQNFKSLGLSLLLLGTPLMIVANLFVTYFQMDLGAGSLDLSKGLPSYFWYMYLVIIPVYIIAYSWLMTVTYAYINEYLKGNREITPGQVFGVAYRKFGRIVGASILVGIITGFGMILLVIPGIYFGVALVFVSAIVFIEEDTIFEAISRSISLIKGKWWSTFGLLIVMSFVVGIMQLLFAIPTYVNLGIKALHQNLFAFDWGTIVSNMIATIGVSLLSPLVFIAIAFQYFNLVERKESAGLKQQILMAGKQAEETPKNEGEY